jgi:hypothetical protein
VRLTTLLCKIITVAKSKEVKTGWSTNMAEFFKEEYGSKRTVSPIMIIEILKGR